jgi:ribonuclease BN (tRNA processing enzyme)
VKLVFLGVRGSTQAPGREFADYGGHTSCLAVLADGEQHPRLVIDAGTGLRELPGLLDGAPFRGTIVLSHLHWDHVHGLPFCPAVDRPDAVVRIALPVGPGEEPLEVLSRGFSPPHFPVRPDELNGSWTFVSAVDGVVEAGVRVAEAAHKGGRTWGIRVEMGSATLGYLSDHRAPAATAATVDLVSGVDVLVHDGQYVASERSVADLYGHSTIEDALRFADRCDVGSVILTHHSPGRTDEQLHALARRFQETPGGRPVRFARQGAVVELSESVRSRD